MNEELLKNIILLSIMLEVIMIAVIVVLQIRIYKYGRRIYFVKRDRERCNELLYSAKDGYFCFVYPDQKVKDPQKTLVEKCSRRLAVMLNLKNGTASSFEDILDSFYKDDVRLLKKYVSLLQQEGLAFEDVLTVKGGHRYVGVYGSRVNGADKNLYCDVVWFRDITAEAEKIAALENEQQEVCNTLKRFENMIDGLNYPVWIRDEQLNLLAVNKKYAEYCGQSNKETAVHDHIEICNNNGEEVCKNTAELAQKSKKMQHGVFHRVMGGKLYNFEVFETPYFIDDDLDKIGTVGCLSDSTELENVKRSFKINQNNHLEVLAALGTAFAIFDDKQHLFFYNSAFRNLWHLDTEFLETNPLYMKFLETVREQKLLPPVPDFNTYRTEELQVFETLLETKEDLLHLPDGRTIRRLRTPHPKGVIFAFEDVSDRLATMRRLNDLTSMQQNILDNLNDAVVIFGSNRRLKFYNRSYLKLWQVDIAKMQDEPKLEQIISYQNLFFSNVDDWPAFEKTMLANIAEGRQFDLLRDDNVSIAVSPLIFYDGSIMITYTKKTK
ncbi:MAG: PAS domain-containing protein [Alphaproteobacteria bacterium]|nr:PAS domain-containing protein [Alphaproteobacteria bacterium]